MLKRFYRELYIHKPHLKERPEYKRWKESNERNLKEYMVSSIIYIQLYSGLNAVKMQMQMLMYKRMQVQMQMWMEMRMHMSMQMRIQMQIKWMQVRMRMRVQIRIQMRTNL